MPWTTADVDRHHAGLSDKQKSQWVSVANSCLSSGDHDEGACVRIANAAVNKSKEFALEIAEVMEGDKSYQYVDSYEYADRQISQANAGYTPLGGSSTEACANCQFFIPPMRCAVVGGEISPTGHSSYWHAKEVYSPPPIPVTIVGDVRSTDSSTDPSLAVRPGVGILDRLRSLVGGQRSATSLVHRSTPFSLVKQKDGRTRFYCVWSNNFKDREGEIFTAASHKEFVDWAEAKGDYPELWMWHTVGSKFGQVDWLDATDDGFVHASGLVDAGKEALAMKLAEKEMGVSHGFFGLQQANVVHWYRSYELSVLPVQNAAVWTTSFNLLNAGKAAEEMGFTPARREFFTKMGITEDQIKAWESQTDGLANTLKDMGLESKAADMGVEVEPPPTPEQKADNEFRIETTKTLMGIQEVLAGLASQVKSIDERTKDIKSGDAVVAAAMTPPAAGTVVAASKDDNNVVSNDPNANPQASAASDFFRNTVLGPLVGATGGAQG